jgi:ABC-type Na+ efflux pump permease subunit
MTLSWRRIRAITRKELRDFRRNRSIVASMAVVPLLFVLPPLIQIFGLAASTSVALHRAHVLVYMLGIPAIVPSFVAAYSVVGERQQGTLEPMLSTPIRREELILGKALAAFIPSIAIAYGLFAVVLVCIGLFAQPAVSTALLQGPDLLAQVVFTPLLATLSIWIAIAISTRATDARVAQQLSALAALPAVAVSTLVAYSVIDVSSFVVRLMLVVVALDVIGWRIVSAAFDRERLITGTK